MIWRRLLGYFPASLAGGLASFGAVFALTRLPGPTEYGIYALALTTIGVIYTLSITWAAAAAYRLPQPLSPSMPPGRALPCNNSAPAMRAAFDRHGP